MDAANDNSSKLGDFKYAAGTKGTTDYSYDVNGNLTSNANKKISGICYNHLNLPANITVTAKGSIEYVYDAGGNKLKKVVHEAGQSDKTTLYLFGTYEDNALQFLPHEEGRIRVITPYNNANDPANVIGGGVPLSGGKEGVFDYFITDHLASIRAVITEEVNKASNVCTMEDANNTVKQVEEWTFGNYINNEVAGTRVSKSAYAPDWVSNTSQKISRLIAVNSTPKTGPNVILKVMAGDKISTKVDYYWMPVPEGD